MNILITGGAGYIGSHTCVELINAGHDVTVVDNLSNSSEKAIRRVEQICGKKLRFYQADVRDEAALRAIFADRTTSQDSDANCANCVKIQHFDAGCASSHDSERNRIKTSGFYANCVKIQHFDAVLHLAGLKAVGESVENPLSYYETNIGSTLSLCRVMKEFGCKKLVFSSSATVYGTPDRVPVDEGCKKGNIASPYGRTKSMIEDILFDIQASDPSFGVVVLRYFNPIGAHKSGLIGENPKGRPNNLLPALLDSLSGKQPCLNVFGGDYDTPDGTGIRDYIHVVDLAKGHLKALEKLESIKDSGGSFVYNLGTGKGCSVLELITAFEKACGVKVNYKIAPRRPGDIACYYANPQKAEKELDWRAELTVEDMCADAWRWRTKNPNGYKED